MTAMSTPKVLASMRIGPHNKNILDILIGSLLGDGTMEVSDDSYNFAFYQEKPNGEYLLWLHQNISSLGYCKPEIPQIMSRTAGDPDRIRYVFRFRTYRYTSFKWIYDGFYIQNGKVRSKVIPEWISSFLTPQVIAIWIMDDGSYFKNKGIRFCTNAFKLEDIKRLGTCLEIKYGLSYSIHKTGTLNQYGLYLTKKSLDKLIPLVRPHMHKTMLYKLGIL